MAIVKCQKCSKEFEARRNDAKWCPECRQIKHRGYWTAYQNRTRKPCPKCGTLIHRRSTLCHPCENKTRIGRYSGENNPSWKGGRSRQSNGYVYVLGKRQGRKHRYQLEHIKIWENANGRLPEGWIIHHLNGIKDDNCLENLVAMSRKRHNPMLIVQPYQERIKQLEAELRSK